MIARSQMHWITETGMFFEKKGPVWDTLRELEARLQGAGIEYLVIGGLALNAHDYERQTIDVDVVMRRVDFEKFKQTFGDCYERAPGTARRFFDPRSEVNIDILLTGGLAGRRDKNKSVRFPDPAEREIHGGIPTVSLARLIELKLVTWRYKDWGDVVELIRAHNLPENFAEQLDATVQTAYGQCYDQATDPNYAGPEEES